MKRNTMAPIPDSAGYISIVGDDAFAQAVIEATPNADVTVECH